MRPTNMIPIYYTVIPQYLEQPSGKNATFCSVSFVTPHSHNPHLHETRTWYPLCSMQCIHTASQSWLGLFLFQLHLLSKDNSTCRCVQSAVRSVATVIHWHAIDKFIVYLTMVKHNHSAKTLLDKFSDNFKRHSAPKWFISNPWSNYKFKPTPTGVVWDVTDTSLAATRHWPDTSDWRGTEVPLVNPFMLQDRWKTNIIITASGNPSQQL